MSTMASLITSLTIVYSTVYSGGDQRKYQSSASLALVRVIHRWPVNSPHKGPVTRKMFPFDDVIMILIWGILVEGPNVGSTNAYNLYLYPNWEYTASNINTRLRFLEFEYGIDPNPSDYEFGIANSDWRIQCSSPIGKVEAHTHYFNHNAMGSYEFCTWDTIIMLMCVVRTMSMSFSMVIAKYTNIIKTFIFHA